MILTDNPFEHSVSEKPNRELLIATWGDPAKWSEAKYLIGGKEYGHCTSLIPILLSMRERVETGEVNLVIIVLESLIDYNPSGTIGGSSSFCRTCVEECSGILEKARESGSYAEIRSRISEFIEKVYNCLLEKYGIALSVQPRVIVAPAIGSPAGNWRFIGGLKDFESIVLKELGDFLLSTKYSKIIVDLTHGINFMPSLTMRLIPRLASILLLRHPELSSVEAVVYNSDPYPLKRNGTPLLNINEAYRETLETIQLIHSIPHLTELLDRFKTDEHALQVYKKANKLSNEILFGVVKHIYKSLYYPLPLALCYFTSPDDCKSLDKVSSIIKDVLDSVRIVRNGSNGTIERPVSIEPDAVYAYLISKAVCERINEMTDSTSGSITKRGWSLEFLEKSVAPIYKKVHKAFETLIKHEISKLGDKVGPPRYRGGSQCNPDNRIMVAHAGFQNGCIDVSDGLVKYIKDPEEIFESLKL